VAAPENEALVRRLYEAFGKRDGAALAALLAEDVTWHVPGRSPVSGDHHPRERVFAFFGDLGARSGGTFHATLTEVFASGHGAIARAEVRGERPGKRYDSHYLLRFRIEGGRVREAWLVNEDQAAFEAFWA